MLKILAFIIILFYAGRFLAKLLFAANSSQKQSTPEEGDVVIHHDKNRQQKTEQKDKKGEYVNYEEID